MQGNHEELKIMLQNCLISSRFNQELSLQRKEHHFIREMLRENRGPSDLVKTDRRPQLCDDHGPRSHDTMIPLLSHVRS